METTINKPLYDALKAANVDDNTATNAAASVVSHSDDHLATKEDLHKLEIRLIMWVVGSILVGTLVDKLWVV